MLAGPSRLSLPLRVVRPSLFPASTAYTPARLSPQPAPRKPLSTSRPRATSQDPHNEALAYLEAKRQRQQARTGRPPSRHALFYRDLVPPLLRILAYGSSAYFALHLLWNLLDRDEQRAVAERKAREYQRQIGDVDRQLKRLPAGKGRVTTTEGKEPGEAEVGSSWFGWMWPSSGKGGGGDKV